MKLGSKWRRRFFWIIVQTPWMLLTVILITFFAFWLVSYNSVTGLYIRTEGRMYLNRSNLANSYIEVFINKNFRDQIGRTNRVIWYTKSDGPRYNGGISKVFPQRSGGLMVWIQLSQVDLFHEFGSLREVDREMVKVELFYRNKRVLNKFFEQLF